MKKLLLSFLGIAAIAATTLTSCKKDSTDETKPAPTITLIPSANSVEVASADSAYTVAVSYHADEKLATISVKRTYNGTTTTFKPDQTSGFNSETDQTTVYNDIKAEATGTVTFEFSVTDKNGESTSKTLSIYVKKAVTGGAITSYSAKLMGGQTNPNAGSFFATSTGLVYTSSDAKNNQSLIDFVYFYGTTNMATIAAPSDADANTAHSGNTSLGTWTTKNNTVFATSSMTASEFDALTDDTQIVTAASGASLTKVSQLSVGQVAAFVTVAGKKGLFKVTAIGGTSGADRTITIDVKVQK